MTASACVDRLGGDLMHIVYVDTLPRFEPLHGLFIETIHAGGISRLYSSIDDTVSDHYLLFVQYITIHDLIRAMCSASTRQATSSASTGSSTGRSASSSLTR